MSYWLLCLAAGAYAGFVSGLLGLGGAVVVVPALTLAFTLQGIDAREVERMAIATSLASLAFTSLASMRAHAARGAVDGAIVRTLAPGVVAGTFVGALVAARLPSAVLQALFVVAIAAIALSLALDLRPAPSRELPGRAGLAVAGATIGGVSSLVGLGGGVLTIPFLTWCNVGIHRAIGTSTAVGVLIAIAGTAGFVVAGWHRPTLPAATLGYVHLPSLAAVVLASVVVAPLGASIAHRCDASSLKRVFACVIVGVGVAVVSRLA